MSGTIEVGPESVVEILHALGATMVAEQRDEAGALLGYEVSPAVDLSGYEAALAAFRKSALIGHLKACRWLCETAGIVVDGVPIATDDRSKMMLIGSRLAAMASPETYITPWAALDGSTHQFDAAKMIAVSDAALAHVQACFNLQGELWGAIEAGTITTTEEIDAASWPANVT